MTSTLRPELLTPTPPYVRRLLVGSVIGAAGVAIMASGYQARAEEPISISLREPADVALPEAELVARETVPPVPVVEIAIAFSQRAWQGKLVAVDGSHRMVGELVDIARLFGATAD